MLYESYDGVYSFDTPESPRKETGAYRETEGGQAEVRDKEGGRQIQGEQLHGRTMGHHCLRSCYGWYRCDRGSIRLVAAQLPCRAAVSDFMTSLIGARVFITSCDKTTIHVQLTRHLVLINARENHWLAE